ncbi:hypothetical protein [Thermodesulfovibrio thiophilus]|uniref:recombination directionality factor n=1 Tax=Thermodesulfovibrio thiophilus TaxID=340095 RepID=UPI0003FCE522|nr:hypothetical protein [Thermodesulfovibrio thiophilus]
MRKKITRIKGISERRRLPRLGKIRLGVKVINPKTGREYPREVDYFVVPPEVAKIYGEKPKELDVLFPVNDIDVVFPQAYKWYGSSKGLKCYGDGEIAYRWNEKKEQFEQRPCSCELKDRECMARAHLLVILPKVSMGGVYQIDIGSYNSIVDINSGLEYIQSLIGRFAMVMLKLKRVPREVAYNGVKKIHYPLQITLENVDVQTIMQLRQDLSRALLESNKTALPPIEDVNPRFDEGAVVVVDETEEEEMLYVEPVEPAVDEPEIETHDETEEAIAPPVTTSQSVSKHPSGRHKQEDTAKMATEQQQAAIRKLAEFYEIDFSIIDRIIASGLTEYQAGKVISDISKKGKDAECIKSIINTKKERTITTPPELETVMEPF